jgi:hypothetical protein
MRHAKLLGIAMLAAMVSVGCGQAPTMNADISGYNGYRSHQSKQMSRKESAPSQTNVVGSINIGHRIDQNIEQEQTGIEQSNASTVEQENEQETNALLNIPIASPATGTNAATVTQSNTATSAQAQSATNAATIEGDIVAVIDINQSNRIGSRDSRSKKGRRYSD